MASFNDSNRNNPVFIVKDLGHAELLAQDALDLNITHNFSPLPSVSDCCPGLLNVDVDAGRKVDAHEGINGLRGWVENVDQTLVRTHLEVLARVLVLVRRTDDAVNVLFSWQRHR